ncbi:MAG TPA: hypothetical protein VLT59_08780 [Steroidobacteraceae bacterium]|nr:hypothetical protein [Steroidobacteraceae bacterium]
MEVTEIEQINRYLAGTLPEADQAAFEARMFRDATFRAEVELSREMRAGLADLRRTGELDHLTRRASSFWQRPAFGLAASALAVVASIVAFASYEQIRTLRAELAAATTSVATLASTGTGIEVLRLIRTRSGGDRPDLTWQVDPGVAELELRLDVGLEPAPTYVFQLKRVEEAARIPIITAPALAPADGELAVTLNAALLTPGRYDITAVDPSGAPIEFRLDVLPGG